ncbi:MAG: DUF2156 domain-containing protein, partial [Clostridiaceae bacterium]|nr:DUF2156 domain-containing protein [Clostridiaceae bacterium]
MNFSPIELCHKPLIDRYLAEQRIESSEMTFLSLYIWRRAFNIKFAQHSGCMVIAFRDNDYPPSLRFPMGDGDKHASIMAACQHFTDQGFEPRFYGLTTDMTEQLVKLFPNKFEITPMRDYFDYVYSVERLISLSGNELHSKRNHVNGFKRMYQYEYKPLTKSDRNEIKTVYDEWFSDTNKNPDYYLIDERQSIYDIIENFDVLGCK